MDVENGLPPPIPFSLVAELEDEGVEPALAVVEVTKLNSVPVYVVGVPVSITRLSSPVLEAVLLDVVDVPSSLSLEAEVAELAACL